MSTLESPVIIEPYAADDSDGCLEIERRSPQGASVRLGFRRPTFHRRAENFDDHALWVARRNGALVGVVGVAFKDVTLIGAPKRAAFYYDLRVAPEVRGQGVATRLAEVCSDYAAARSDFGYCYVMDDNRAMEAMRRLFGCWEAGGYRYLVLPTYRGLVPGSPVRRASLSDVHEAMVETAPPFDFYTDPRVAGSTAGHVASWQVRTDTGRAGLSAWDNRGILAEVVERLPWSLRVLRFVIEGGPWARGRHPHIPAPGEALRSWYLFDVHGTEPALVVDVLRQVAADAREAGVDFLYLPWIPGDEAWVAAARRDVPWWLRTEVRYRLLVGRPLEQRVAVPRPYVDVRDL